MGHACREAGNASPHGMSFYTVGSRRFFSNGEIGPGTHYTPGLGLTSEETLLTSKGSKRSRRGC